MPQSLAKILVHVIFSTKDRYAFLSDNDIRGEMQSYLAGAFKQLGSPTLIVNGVADHMHVLCSLGRNDSISGVIKEAKRNSSTWIKTKGGILEKFHWQNGYGAFSLSQSLVSQVRTYIANQAEHHRKVTFQDELREFLAKYEIEYDERYVWD